MGKGGCRRYEGPCVCFPEGTGGTGRTIAVVTARGVVEKRVKIRIIHDMTLEHRDWSGEGSVNSTTDWDEIPSCALAGVMHEVVQSVLGLRVKFGDRAWILIQNIDVKNAFRQILVDPDGDRVFGYVLRDFLFIDLRLQVGWRGSSGWWWVILAAMQHAQRSTTRDSALFSPAWDHAVEHVTVAQKTERSVVSWPAECVVRGAEEGGGQTTRPLWRFLWTMQFW